MQNTFDDKKPIQNNTPWWHEGIAFFFEVTSWIIGPIILGIIIGTYLDHRYQSGPKYLTITVIVAFLITNLGLILQVKKYVNKMKDIESDKHETDRRNQT